MFHIIVMILTITFITITIVLNIWTLHINKGTRKLMEEAYKKRAENQDTAK